MYCSCQSTVPDDMDGSASFEALPSDLIQRIAAFIPNNGDKDNRRCFPKLDVKACVDSAPLEILMFNCRLGHALW